MIISRRDEGMAVACQGLTGDLVIFSSMFWGEVKDITSPCAYRKHCKRKQRREKDRYKEMQNARE